MIYSPHASTDDKDAGRKHVMCYIPNIIRCGNYVYTCSGLSNSRSENERKDIVEHLLQKFEDTMTKAPAEHGVEFVQAYVHDHVRKI